MYFVMQMLFFLNETGVSVMSYHNKICKRRDSTLNLSGTNKHTRTRPFDTKFYGVVFVANSSEDLLNG